MIYQLSIYNKLLVMVMSSDGDQRFECESAFCQHIVQVFHKYLEVEVQLGPETLQSVFDTRKRLLEYIIRDYQYFCDENWEECIL